MSHSKHLVAEQSVGSITVASNRRGPQWIARACALALLGSVAVSGGIGCKRSDAQTGAHERPPPAVTVAPAVAQDVPMYIDQIGKTAPLEMVNVMPRITGQISDRPFTDGQEVTTDTILYQIDPELYKTILAQAEANANQQDIALKWANREFERIKGLVDNKAVSRQDYEQKESAVATADAQLKAAQAAVKQARVNLGYCTIKSPITGRVGQHQIDVGNVVKANEATLVTVQNLDKIYADFTIPESSLQEVRERMADGTLKVEVWIPSDAEVAKMQSAAQTPAIAGNAASRPATLPAVVPTTPAAPATQAAATRPAIRTGDLTFLDTSVQSNLGTVKLRATLDNTDRHFWPGQFVNIRLILTTKKDAVLVPLQALQVGQRGPFVYVVKPDSTAEMVPVQRGQRQGDQVVILSGVKPADRVIVTGQGFVGPGAKVHVVEGAPGL